MSAVEISYKDNLIAELDEAGTVELATNGKYCEDNIVVDYAGSSGGGIELGTITITNKTGSPVAKMWSLELDEDFGYIWRQIEIEHNSSEQINVPLGKYIPPIYYGKPPYTLIFKNFAMPIEFSTEIESGKTPTCTITQAGQYLYQITAVQQESSFRNRWILIPWFHDPSANGETYGKDVAFEITVA